MDGYESSSLWAYFERRKHFCEPHSHGPELCDLHEKVTAYGKCEPQLIRHLLRRKPHLIELAKVGYGRPEGIAQLLDWSSTRFMDRDCRHEHATHARRSVLGPP